MSDDVDRGRARVRPVLGTDTRGETPCQGGAVVMGLTEFLTARLEYDTATAKTTRNRREGRTERLLREVAAKRAILALHTREFVRVPQPDVKYRCEGCSQETWPCQTLEALAGVYSDHPDYLKASAALRE